MKEQMQYKFYSCKYDRTFKEVFLNPNNSDILKTLLEEVLDIKINTIELQPTEMNSGNINVARKTVDVLLDTDKGKIEIEVNSSMKDYIHPRNLAYLCNIYSRHTLVGGEYTEDTNIIQLNLSYGMKDEKIIREYNLMDEEEMKFVKNFKIYEINMDKILEFWYHKDKKNINKFKHLIMLGLNEEELVKMDKEDKVVKKYYDQMIVVNNDPAFQEYMSKEEDERKIKNSLISQAKREAMEKGMEKGIKQGRKQGINEKTIEIARNLISMNFKIEDIEKATGLSKKELENLNN